MKNKQYIGKCKKHRCSWTGSKGLGCPECQEEEQARYISLLKLCTYGSASGRKGEMLLCGFKRGHKGNHAWASLPTFTNGKPI